MLQDTEKLIVSEMAFISLVKFFPLRKENNYKLQQKVIQLHGERKMYMIIKQIYLSSFWKEDSGVLLYSH